MAYVHEDMSEGVRGRVSNVNYNSVLTGVIKTKSRLSENIRKEK